MNLLVIKPRPSLATLEMSEPGPAATPLAGKTMLVTGAGGTLGRSLVELGRSLGASVVAWVRTPSAELGDDVRQIVGDLRSEQELVRGAALAGEIDILVNNAAVLDGELAAVLAINVIAPHELIGRFVPGMIARRFGRIINITSDLSVVPSGDHLAYAASKAALNSLVASWGARLAGTGVLINALHPGHFKSRINPTGPCAAEASWAMAATLMTCGEDGPTGRAFGPDGELDWLTARR